MTETQRVRLASGITLNVALAGREDAPPAILLHGFPESHRTWRAVAPLISDEVRLVMPDLRGFGDSDRPQDIADYATDTLVGHDWGGAVAWAAAIRGDPRITRLAIVNSPHPAIFQRSIIDDPQQRAASQYIRAFRDSGMEAAVARMGVDAFFDKSFTGHVDLAAIPADERQHSIDDWSRDGALTAMFNWYRASQIVAAPDPARRDRRGRRRRRGDPAARCRPFRPVAGAAACRRRAAALPPRGVNG